MSGAERQARFRAKERVLERERKVQALRNAIPESAQQLARDNEALRERVQQLEKRLHNGSVFPSGVTPEYQNVMAADRLLSQ